MYAAGGNWVRHVLLGLNNGIMSPRSYCFLPAYIWAFPT